MKVVVELNCGECFVYDEKLLTAIAIRTIESSGFFVPDNALIMLSVAFVSEDEIQRVNREFRQKDSVTDVISVGDYSDNCDISQETKLEIFLGEIILCYNYIAQNSQENGVDVDQEFFTVYSHGILHLLGFDHGKKMFNIQERIGKEFS